MSAVLSALFFALIWAPSWRAARILEAIANPGGLKKRVIGRAGLLLSGGGANNSCDDDKEGEHKFGVSGEEQNLDLLFKLTSDSDGAHITGLVVSL